MNNSKKQIIKIELVVNLLIAFFVVFVMAIGRALGDNVSLLSQCIVGFLLGGLALIVLTYRDKEMRKESRHQKGIDGENNLFKKINDNLAAVDYRLVRNVKNGGNADIDFILICKQGRGY